MNLQELKAEKFTVDGRKARIQRSLDAVNAPNPTDLTADQWKQVMENGVENGY